MSKMSKITFDVKGEVSGHQCVRDAVGMEDGPSLSVKRPLGNRGNPAPVSKMSESATPKAPRDAQANSSGPLGPACL